MPTISYKFNNGMNNVDDPINVGAPVPNSRQLIFTEMIKIVNADPDNYDSLSLRPGQVSVSDTASHSGWSNPYNPREMFCVQGTNLMRLWLGMTTTVVRSGLTAGLRMVFCQVNDVVAYSNGLEQGIIENGVDVAPFVPSDSFKLPMAAGQFLEWYNGRLYALKDNVLYCSDSLDTPGGIESMDERQCIVAVFDGPGTMLQRVDDGLFVSAGKETFFFKGNEALVEPRAAGWGRLDGFQQISVATHAAIPYTACPVKAELIGINGLTGNACIWTSERYICIGGNGGFFQIKDKFAFKAGYRGAAVLREAGGLVHYLSILQSAPGAEYNMFQPQGISVDDQ